MINLATITGVINRLLPGHVQERDISYGGHPKMLLDVYGEKATVLKPVIMFWHGGSWQSGSKDYYRFMADYIERLGAIPVIVGYPLAPEQTFPEMIADVRLAVQWAQNNIAAYGGDPERVYVMGHSSGAHLAVIATLQDDDQAIAGCIAFATPVHISHTYYADVFTKDTFKQGLENPVNHIGGTAHNFLLVHGRTDRIVGHQASAQLDSQLRKAGNSVEFISLRFMGHMRLITTMVRPFAYRYTVGKRIKALIS